MKTLKVLSYITTIVSALWVVLAIAAALFGGPVAGVGYLLVFGLVFASQGILTLRQLHQKEVAHG